MSDLNEDGTPRETLPHCDYCEDEMPGDRWLSEDREYQYCSETCKECATSASCRERAEKAEREVSVLRSGGVALLERAEKAEARVAELEALLEDVLRLCASDELDIIGRIESVAMTVRLSPSVGDTHPSDPSLCAWCDERPATETDADGQRVCAECYEGAPRPKSPDDSKSDERGKLMNDHASTGALLTRLPLTNEATVGEDREARFERAKRAWREITGEDVSQIVCPLPGQRTQEAIPEGRPEGCDCWGSGTCSLCDPEGTGVRTVGSETTDWERKCRIAWSERDDARRDVKALRAKLEQCTDYPSFVATFVQDRANAMTARHEMWGGATAVETSLMLLLDIEAMGTVRINSIWTEALRIFRGKSNALSLAGTHDGPGFGAAAKTVFDTARDLIASRSDLATSGKEVHSERKVSSSVSRSGSLLNEMTPWGVWIQDPHDKSGWYAFVDGSERKPTRSHAENVATNLNESRAPDAAWVAIAKPHPLPGQRTQEATSAMQEREAIVAYLMQQGREVAIMRACTRLAEEINAGAHIGNRSDSATPRALDDDAAKEIARLRNVIVTGGAMYRAERAALGVPGGEDSPSDSATPDYSWIKVKRYVDDPSKPWEERYRALERHHEVETQFLIAEVERLRAETATDAARLDWLDVHPEMLPALAGWMPQRDDATIRDLIDEEMATPTGGEKR